MFAVGKPTYALLGCRESYSIGNRQDKKDALFAAALRTIHDTINKPNFVSIPDLVTTIYCGDDSQLNPIREALKSNSLFPCTTCLSASGNKILAYLAVLHDKECLNENGTIDLAYTKDTIRSFFADETKNMIQFDDSAIRNLKSEESHFKFGKNRFAHLNLLFTSQDSINAVRNKEQNSKKSELSKNPNTALANKQRKLTTEMFQAFTRNDKATVQKMLRAGAQVDSRDANGSTPLIWAACNDWLNVAQDLLTKSLPDTINAVNQYGNTAFIFACNTLTDIPFLTQLLERSSPEAINTVNHLGNSSLFLACDSLTNIPFLTQLLKLSSPKAINTVSQDGNSALLLACNKLTDIPFLTRLLELSSPEAINTVNAQGHTALMALVWNPNNHQTVQHLLPLLLPRLTLKNLQIAYKSKNMTTAKTAWQLAHERGPGPWETIAEHIADAMLITCAQHLIPRGRPHHAFAADKKDLTKGFETPANVFEKIFHHKMPMAVLDLIRSYHESPFNHANEALAVINRFLCWHLELKNPTNINRVQLFHSVRSVDKAVLALHDSQSPLSLCLAK